MMPRLHFVLLLCVSVLFFAFSTIHHVRAQIYTQPLPQQLHHTILSTSTIEESSSSISSPSVTVPTTTTELPLPSTSLSASPMAISSLSAAPFTPLTTTLSLDPRF